MKISNLILTICLTAIFVAAANSAQAEVGYRCLEKELVFCPAVVPTCVKQSDGSYTTFPLLGDECFDISNCYKQETNDLNTLVDDQAAQIAKLQNQVRKAKAQLRAKRAK